MGVETRRRTQVERRDEAERKMLEAGARLVARGGMDRLTLADVGTTAGYSRGLPAHHFKTKEAFLKALMNFVVEEYTARLDEPAATPGLSAFVELARSFLSRASSDETFLCATQIILSDVGDGLAKYPEVVALRDEQKRLMEHQIREGIRNGEIRPDVEPESLSPVIIAAARGVLEMSFADPTLDISGPSKELIGLISWGLRTTQNATRNKRSRL